MSENRTRPNDSEYQPLKVGDLARRTGLTVRTLHHYDEIGLLKPSLRTESGYRLYAAADVARLQQIVSLRQLGFALDEIRACLDRLDFSPLELLSRHIAVLREQIDWQRTLCQRLQALADGLRAAGTVSTEDFLKTIEAMTMIDKYYTPEQMEYLKQRRETVGEQRMQQAPDDWAKLMAEMKTEMEKGTDLAAPEVQALARRWQGLIDEFTGGDKGVEQSLGRLWKDQGPNLAAQHSMNYDPRLFEYAGKALAMLKNV